MPESSAERLLVWRAGKTRCAAALGMLQEVVPAGGITPIPGAPPAICGLANVRGRVVTVVDARALVGERVDRAPGVLVLVRLARRTVALGVDEVEDLVTDAAAVRLLDLEGLLAPLFPE
jgi:purine-binding chemotaxis protein CheW